MCHLFDVCPPHFSVSRIAMQFDLRASLDPDPFLETWGAGRAF